MNRRALLAVAATTALAVACGRQAPQFRGNDLTGAAFGRGFRLTDTEGRERTLADFRGRLVMVFFGFTQCPDVCPTALAKAAEVRRQLGRDGERVAVVFITVDPERDTAALLREYVGAFDPSFFALRGDADATRAVAHEFRVIFEKVATASSYTINHTALTYVFDTEGRLRIALRHQQPVEDYVADLRALAESRS